LSSIENSLEKNVMTAIDTQGITTATSKYVYASLQPYLGQFFRTIIISIIASALTILW